MTRYLPPLLLCAAIAAGCNQQPEPSGHPAAYAPDSASGQAVGALGSAIPPTAEHPSAPPPVSPSPPSAAPTAKSPPAVAGLVGKWNVTNKYSDTIRTRTYEFDPNGTFILMNIETGPDNKGTITMMTTGTYKFDGKSFSKHVVAEKESTDVDSLKSVAENDNKTFAKEANAISEYSGTLKWKDNDDAVISAGKGIDPGVEQEIDLKRIKG